MDYLGNLLPSFLRNKQSGAESIHDATKEAADPIHKTSAIPFEAHKSFDQYPRTSLTKTSPTIIQLTRASLMKRDSISLPAVGSGSTT